MTGRVGYHVVGFHTDTRLDHMQANTTIRLAAGDHVVHFYEDDDDLVAVVTRYLGSALSRNEAAVVVATPDHAARFQDGFASAGVDVAAAEAESRLIVLDAAETLAAFSLSGRTDGAAFEAVVGPVLRRARAAGTHVCVYGEMVTLLMDAGRARAAVDLEERWNALRRSEAFSLLCAYPSTADSSLGPERAETYVHVCGVHSDVIAEQPVPDDAESSCAFPRGPNAPAQARRFVADVLHQWELDELVDPANLIVSELATNAVLHAHSGFTVSLNHDGPVIRIAVGDGASEVPQRALAGSDAPRGRGLPIIEAVASRWGHFALDRGKLVWAELSGEPALTSASSR